MLSGSSEWVASVSESLTVVLTGRFWRSNYTQDLSSSFPTNMKLTPPKWKCWKPSLQLLCYRATSSRDGADERFMSSNGGVVSKWGGAKRWRVGPEDVHTLVVVMSSMDSVLACLKQSPGSAGTLKSYHHRWFHQDFGQTVRLEACSFYKSVQVQWFLLYFKVFISDNIQVWSELRRRWQNCPPSPRPRWLTFILQGLLIIE